jgi:large subunit ribosomal protein L10
MRVQKTDILEELKGWLTDSTFLFVIDYKGLTVSQFTELRNRLFAAGATCHVVKNTLMVRSLKEANWPELANTFQGQTAVVYGSKDAAAAAKVLKNFQAEFEKPAIRAGVVDQQALDAAGVKTIADLPSREVLLATLLGLINTPATSLARVLNTPAGQVAQVIKAKSEKGE